MLFLEVEVFPSESDELSQQLPSTIVSRTQEFGSSVLSGSVVSGPALVSAKATSPSGSPQLSEDDTNKIIENLFTPAQKNKMHNFYRWLYWHFKRGAGSIKDDKKERLLPA